MTVYRLAAAALYLVPVVLLILLARHAWRDLRTVNPDPPRPLLTVVVVWAAVLHLSVHALFWLAGADVGAPAWRVLFGLNTLTGVAMVAAGAHVVRLVARRRAGATWLTLNYGAAVPLGALAVALPLLGPESGLERRLIGYLFLFQTYVIASVALSLKENGTGLGLAIARRTVEAHGGHISATAADGGGMAFRIELPLAGEP
jgi:hypothetical protein